MKGLLSLSAENTSGLRQIMPHENDNDEDICAYAYILITPEKPYENNEFHIKLKMINKKVSFFFLLNLNSNLGQSEKSEI